MKPSDQQPSWLNFEGYSLPNPDYPPLEGALHTARYNLTALTQADAYCLLACAEAYLHFAGHPATNKLVTKQLQALRRRVKANRKK